MRSRLSAYAYPRKVEFVDELPKTLTGKIRRIELRQRRWRRRRAGERGRRLRRRYPWKTWIGPLRTTSNALPGTLFSWLRSSSFQRRSLAPVKYHELPWSARIMP